MKKNIIHRGVVTVLVLIFVGSSMVPNIFGLKTNEHIETGTQPALAPGRYSEDWSITEVVSTQSTYDSVHPSLYVDMQGTIHVAWSDDTNYGGSGPDRDIFYKCKPSGESWSITEVVSTESTSTSEDPSLFVDMQGTVHIAWEDYSNYGGSDSYYDIFYKCKPSGESWSITEIVSTESTNDAYNPSLFVDMQDTVHVAWEDFSNYSGSGQNFDIFYKCKPSGESWSITEVVSTENARYCHNPSLFVDMQGTIHVAWEDLMSSSGGDWDIFYKCKPSGESWSIVEVVSTEYLSDSYDPSLFVDMQGTIHVSWEEGTRDIYYKYKPSNGSWSSITELVSSESTTGRNHNPSLFVDMQGTIHVAWEDSSNYGGSDSDYDIYYKYKITNQPPVADFTYSPQQPLISTPVVFTDTSSDPDGSIVNWSWDFGDESVSYLQHPIHTYVTAGAYLVTLTVTDDKDATDVISTTIMVYTPKPPSPPCRPIGSGCGVVKKTYVYKTYIPDTLEYLVYYQWSWGDGTTSTWRGPLSSGLMASMKHQWNEPGTYTIKVKAKNIYGLQSDWSASFIVKISQTPNEAAPE